MDKSPLESFVTSFISSDENYVPAALAREPELVGMQIFDEPLFAYAGAHDERFAQLRDAPEAQVPLMLPSEWLPSAQTVMACFFPFAEEVRVSNRGGDEPSWAWLHARIEGQAALFAFAGRLCAFLQEEGYECLCPTQDERFGMRVPGSEGGGSALVTSNWSERHIGHLCGLGTFSLSKGLITEKGIAGRIISVVTSLKLEPTTPQYSGLLEYCSECRRCARNCPVDAIGEFHHKDDRLCKKLLDKVKAKHPPYYGCGKCQVGVPCESRIP